MKIRSHLWWITRMCIYNTFLWEFWCVGTWSIFSQGVRIEQVYMCSYRPALYGKCLEITSVMIWLYINKTELRPKLGVFIFCPVLYSSVCVSSSLLLCASRVTPLLFSLFSSSASSATCSQFSLFFLQPFSSGAQVSNSLDTAWGRQRKRVWWLEWWKRGNQSRKWENGTTIKTIVWSSFPCKHAHTCCMCNYASTHIEHLQK